MIVFVTTRSHAYTVKSLVDGSFGPKLPRICAMAWEDIFHARLLPRATYVFTDMERLAAPELDLAAKIYQIIAAAGLHCLNNPARIRLRYALLHALHASSLNPFAVYRAEASPQPAYFPVFVRSEANHGLPLSELLQDQASLDRHLIALQENGVPLRHLLVIEFCAEPISPGVWRRHGTFRIGPAMHFDHDVIEDNWLVKTGTLGLATIEMTEAERNAAQHNEGAERLRPVFEMAHIEYGRADHAVVGGQGVVYEINTNPNIYPLKKQRLKARDEAQQFARERFAALLAAIDCVDAGEIRVTPPIRHIFPQLLSPLLRRLDVVREIMRPI